MYTQDIGYFFKISFCLELHILTRKSSLILFATSKIDNEFRQINAFLLRSKYFLKFHFICNVSNIIIYCCIDDSTQKNETIRRKNLFKYIGKIIEKADVYICKSVTVLVRLPNTRKKSYLKTLIDACTEALKRRKHCKILRFATKEKQLLSNLAKLCRRSSMI